MPQRGDPAGSPLSCPPPCSTTPASSDPFLPRFVQIFEDVAETVLGRVDGLEHLLDPAVCPEPLLPWLGGWLGLETDGLPPAIQRRLAGLSGRLLSSRGTAGNLTALVAALTGATPRVRDSGGVLPPDEQRPAMPKEVIVEVSTTAPLTPAQLEATLRREIPADAELVLRVGGAG